MQMIRGDQKAVGIKENKKENKKTFKREYEEDEEIDMIEDKPIRMLNKNEFNDILNEHLQDMSKRNVQFKEDLLEDEEYDEEELIEEMQNNGQKNKQSESRTKNENNNINMNQDEEEEEYISKKEKNLQKERDYHSKLK